MLNDTKRKKTLLLCAVLLLSAVSASWMLSKGTLSNHECFVSITSREMIESGDWVMPTCNGQLRLQKTPLSYWLVAGLSRITGSIDEFTARLPSVIFALLSVSAILYFVSRWLSFRIAVVAACVWATSLSYIRYTHNARPEMALTFFITLCFLSFYSAVTAKSRDRQIVYMLVFWTSFGLGNLAKGPVPLPLVLIPLFFYVAIYRHWKVLPKLLPVTGAIISLAIMLPWPLAIGHRVDWNLVVWKQNFFDRFFGEYAPGEKPIYYYLYIMFQFMLPWVAFIPMALAAPFYRVWAKRRPVMEFLWLWFIVDLVFITINGGKRQHYILPLMPAMAILIGILIEDMVFTRKAYTLEYAAGVLRKHIIVLIAGAVALPIYMAGAHPQLFIKAAALSITTIIIIAVVAILFARGRSALACGSVFVGIVLLVMIAYITFFDPLDHNRYSRSFSKEVAQIVPQSKQLVAWEYTSMRTVHYFGRVIPKIGDKSELYKRYEAGDWVLATAGHLEKLLEDDRFRMVFFREKAELRGQANASGALFHKSAPIVKDSSSNHF